MKRNFYVLLFLFMQLGVVAYADFFELRTYRFASPAQQQRTEKYLQEALLPALHRAGIPLVGVFIPIETDSTFGKKLYVLISYKTIDQFMGIDAVLEKDESYAQAGSDYINARYDNPTYVRMEKILMKGFSGMPGVAKPDLKSPVTERLYELRSYEGHTEKISRNKVDMFNAGDEIGLFKRLGFNAVFYGDVVSGPHMPNLIYMTSFENQNSRNAHWKAFVEDAYWKDISSRKEYQNNMSKMSIYFLRATAYSDL